MKRLWLSLAVVGGGLSLGAAWGDEPAPTSRGSASSRLIPVRHADVSSRVIESEGAGLTPVPEDAVVEGGCQECSQAPFFDTMAGIKGWFGQRLELPTLRYWAGADGGILSSDVEDPYWLKFDFMAGWFRGYDAPPLLTTSNPQTSRGILGNEGTRVLFGGGDLDLQQHNGGRFTFGFWTEPSQACGFETRYFFLADRHAGVQHHSTGAPLLAAPFFNALTDTQDALPIANLAQADLGAREGFVDVYANSRFQGLEVSLAHNYIRGTRGRVDFLWGYRYLRLDEGINNNVSIFSPGANPPTTATAFRIRDQFGTENTFHGLNGVMRSQWWWGCWSLDMNSQLAVGATRATGQVLGQTTSLTANGVVNTAAGGIYALPNNMGNTTRLRFAAASEIEVGLGYQVYDHVRVTLGYSFLAMTGVVRPGDLIDTRLNPNQFPPTTTGGPLLPERRFDTSTFWVNSITAGLEIRY